MRIKYFGTAAAEGFPAMYCECDTCERARLSGGKNIRTRSQALINDDLLIDYPADTNMHVLTYGLDLRKVKACLITHSHDDHMYPRDMLYRCKPSAHFKNEENKIPLVFYSTFKSGIDIMKTFFFDKATKKDKVGVEYQIIKKYKTYDIEGYKVTPLRAFHDKRLDPVIYIIEKEGKSILYAHDSGYFTEDTWKYLEESSIIFDLVSLDCTDALRNKSKRHMGLNSCIEVRKRLLQKNANENTKFVLNHFSHNGYATYDDLVGIAKEKGFIVSYDTLEIEV